MLVWSSHDCEFGGRLTGEDNAGADVANAPLSPRSPHPHLSGPKQKVKTWLKEGWRVWQQRPPKWFDEKVRTATPRPTGKPVVPLPLNLYSLSPNSTQWRKKVAKNAPKGLLPRASLKQIAAEAASAGAARKTGEA